MVQQRCSGDLGLGCRRYLSCLLEQDFGEAQLIDWHSPEIRLGGLFAADGGEERSTGFGSMTQQGGGGQGSEGRHPSSSPGAGSSAGNTSNMPNVSLLGQQLNDYGSVQQQQQHHHHQNHQQHPANATLANVNFSLSHPFSKSQQAPQSQGNGNNGGGDGFPNMQNLNSMVAAGQQDFNQSHQFMNQQQANAGGLPDCMKASPQQQAALSVQAALGMQASSAPLSPEAFMGILNALQQKVIELQAIVPFMSQNQAPNVVQQQAAALSQLARFAVNMCPPSLQDQPQQRQQQQDLVLPQPPISDPSQQQQQHQKQQRSQLFEVTPAFNFFQQSGSAPGSNSFSALQGGGSGVNVDLGAAATSLANQIAATDRGVSGTCTSGAAQGMGGPSNSAVSGSGQSFGQGQVGPSAVNSGMVVRSKQGTFPRSNNQMGSGGNNRGASVPGVAGDMGHIGSGRSATSRGGMTASSVEDDDDDGDGENLVPGSYDLIEMEAIEILAEHTHFCELCGKGFKRDANLRMHMRGHGDIYKTAAALARPDKASHEMAVARPKRFSCPNSGCKRNKEHRKFQPLKTMLCVKNHYRRSHCPKILTCNNCQTKKFSVMADLKTHEKHCGCDKWQCSCGTTFSRKDKLFGHVGLFAGHTPALQFSDMDSSGSLGVSELPGNPSSMASPGNDTSGYGLPGGGGMSGGNASSVGLGGGNGMGLGGNGMQGLTSRAGGGGNNPGGMNMSKDGTSIAPENSSSSSSFPSAGLISSPAMLQSIFTTKFYSSSGGNSSSDGLR